MCWAVELSRPHERIIRAKLEEWVEIVVVPEVLNALCNVYRWLLQKLIDVASQSREEGRAPVIAALCGSMLSRRP